MENPTQLQTIETPRLILRPLRIEDSAAMFEVYSDAETMKYWSDEPATNPDNARKRVQADIDWVSNDQALAWAITQRPSEVALGKCVIFQISKQNRRAEIGYILNRSHWGRGLMTEALTAMLDYAFEELDLHRLEVDTDPENHGSLRLMEKLGFKREGLFRDRWHVYGEWHDSVMLAMLKKEWKSKTD